MIVKRIKTGFKKRCVFGFTLIVFCFACCGFVIASDYSEVGSRWYSFVNLFLPKVYDYGKELDGGRIIKSKRIRISPHNVGASYSLTFPEDITCNSLKSIRFEFRYEDTHAKGKSPMQRVRSEISGVSAKTLMSEWTIEYDLYVPFETLDDNMFKEIVTQIHENSSNPISPSFSLSVKGGFLTCSIKGDSIPISKWKNLNKPTHSHIRQLIYLEKNRWYHVKAFVGEGYRYDMNPLTRVWVDGKLLFESYQPNCYNYIAVNKESYNYLKFGIYKPGWEILNKKGNMNLNNNRIYYFDNFIVKLKRRV